MKIPTAHLPAPALLIAGFLLLASGPRASAQVTFQGLGGLQNGRGSSVSGLSPDGLVAAGRASTAAGTEAAYWTQASGIVSLGDLFGGDVNANFSGASRGGGVFVGIGQTGTGANGFQALRTSGSTLVPLGFLGTDSFSAALGVSPDGAVIVGYSGQTGRYEAFRWTSATGMVGLGDAVGGGFLSLAIAISPDTRTIVGAVTDAAGMVAARFAAGKWTPLGRLPGSTSSIANAVNGDGTTIVGSSTSASSIQAFRWSFAGGLQGLGDLPGGSLQSSAQAVSADGRIVVGFGNDSNGNQAFVWTRELGLRRIVDLLPSAGIAIPSWILENAVAISADGNTVVGSGFRDGYGEAWRITGLRRLLPAPKPERLPAARIRGKKRPVITDPRLVLRGTANTGEGNARLIRVEVKTGSGKWKKARGLKKWRFIAKGLKKGATTVRARVVTATGFASRPVAITILRR